MTALIFGGPATAGVITFAWLLVRGRRAHHGRLTRVWWQKGI
jgi:hypothetical protein